MRYYETVYLINPNLADEEYQGVVDKYRQLVEKNRGVLVKMEEWGKKALAYHVKKSDKAYYVLLQYCGDTTIWEEIKRELALDERVLKSLTIKLSDHADPEALVRQAEESKPKKGPEEAEAEQAVQEEGVENGSR